VNALLLLWFGLAHADDAAISAARGLADAGQSADALQALAPLLATADPEAQALAARLRLELGEVTRARQSLEAALAQSPTPAAHLDLARCYQHLGDDEAALAQASLAAQGGVDATPLLVSALARTRAADAAEEVLAGLLPEAERARARVALADAYAAAERHSDAAAMWSQALASNPTAPGAPRWQAEIADSHRQRGQMRDEVAALEALLDTYGAGSAWRRANAAAADDADALIAERLEEAIARYTLDVQMRPQSAATTAAIGDLSRLYTAWLGRYPDASSSPQRQQDYAALLVRQGRFAEALAQYEDAYRAGAGSNTLKNIAHLSYRLMQKAPAEQKRWLRKLLWAAETHGERFGDQEADAEVQWRAAEGLLLADRTADALDGFQAVVDRWPATGSAERSARRILDVHIVSEDWAAARAAARAFQQQASLGDDAFKARLNEVISQTAGP